jgi:AhpD family alkylhydroperoxidase
MSPRLNIVNVAPEAVAAMRNLSDYVHGAGLEQSLMELVEMRASQINGCAYCLHMHSSDARKHGETEERLYLLNAWHESNLYTPRERAALAWTEALTLLPQTHAPDDVFEEVKAQFSEAELVTLSLLIITINSWNRLSVGFRAQHPNDMPRKTAVAA